MGRKNSPSANKELNELIARYEAAKAENRQLYLDGDQLADIADRYAADRKFKDAQETINYGLSIHPENTDLLVEQAYLYLDTQKLEKAKKVADSITEEYDVEVKMLKAEIFLNEGKLEAAKELLNKIDELDELDTIINITYLYLDMGYPEEAKEWLDKGKVEFENKEDFLCVYADYLALTSQTEEAASCYNRLIDMDAYNPSYWMGLAKCRFATEDCDKAIEACDFALAADEKFGEAYAYKAHSYFYLNNSDAAIENYYKAIKYKALPPEMGYMFLGMAHANKDEWEKAYDYYEQVQEIFNANGAGDSPLLIDTFSNQAIAASRLGKHEEAHQLCEKAIEINPEDISVHLTEGKIYLQEEQEEEAFKAFEKVLQIKTSAEVWYLIASCYMEEEMLPQAKLCFEEVYNLNPKYADVTEKLSIISLMHQEIDNFFKYNNESPVPINEDVIQALITQYDNSEKGDEVLKEICERMKRENKNK